MRNVAKRGSWNSSCERVLFHFSSRIFFLTLIFFLHSALGNDPQVIEEEYVIDQPTGGKRKVKVPPLSNPRRSEL